MTSVEVSEWAAYFKIKDSRIKEYKDVNAENAKKRAQENNQ